MGLELSSAVAMVFSVMPLETAIRNRHQADSVMTNLPHKHLSPPVYGNREKLKLSENDRREWSKPAVVTR
jgi:hypothetical protein